MVDDYELTTEHLAAHTCEYCRRYDAANERHRVQHSLPGAIAYELVVCARCRKELERLRFTVESVDGNGEGGQT